MGTLLKILKEQQYNDKAFKKIINDSLDDLYKGYDLIGVEAIKYLKNSGQGGAISTFLQEYKIGELKKIIDLIKSKNI